MQIRLSYFSLSAPPSSETFKGHTLMRREDQQASLQAGFEVLQDTNNSSYDFYEREVQSLHQ